MPEIADQGDGGNSPASVPWLLEGLREIGAPVVAVTKMEARRLPILAFS